MENKTEYKTDTSREQSRNNMYAYEKDGTLSEIITYQSNLMKKLAKECSALSRFADGTGNTDEFMRIAKENGITVYKVEKIERL